MLLCSSCDLLENSYLCGISNNTTASGCLRYNVVICLKIRTFVVSATTCKINFPSKEGLWFAWKFVPLWYQQQRLFNLASFWECCDLLENSYLCGISNNGHLYPLIVRLVVICLKIRTFVVSATTARIELFKCCLLWFAWKFVPLWYQQQQSTLFITARYSCDLLENSYLCGISNNHRRSHVYFVYVVICLKIRTFVVSATT